MLTSQRIRGCKPLEFEGFKKGVGKHNLDGIHSRHIIITIKNKIMKKTIKDFKKEYPELLDKVEGFIEEMQKFGDNYMNEEFRKIVTEEVKNDKELLSFLERGAELEDKLLKVLNY